MALALVLGAHEERRRAAGIEADLGIFRLRRAGRLLDGIDDAEPAQLAALLRLLGPRLIARHVGELDGHVHVLLELAAVIERPNRALVRQCGFREHVLAPQLDTIDAQLARRLVDQPLDQVDRLGPAGTSIGRRRVGVGEHAHHVDVGLGDQVDAKHRADHAEWRQQIAIGADIGADVGDHVEAQRHELVVLVERQLDLADIVATVLVGHHRLAALAGPLDRAQQLARRPQRQPMLDILPALGAEATADVARDHPHLALGHLEDVLRQHVAHAMGILHVGVERHAVLAGIVDA